MKSREKTNLRQIVLSSQISLVTKFKVVVRCIHFVMAMFFHLKITFSLAISASHWTVDLDTGGQRYGSRVV